MYLALDKKGTLYDQIARALKLEILEGRIAAGSKLPSTRTLATALGVARKSVLQAYELLCAEELAIARGGSGTRGGKVTPATRPPARTRVVPLSRYATRARALPPITLAGSRVADRPRYNMVYGEPLIDTALFHSWRRKLSAAARCGMPPTFSSLPVPSRRLQSLLASFSIRTTASSSRIHTTSWRCTVC